MLGAVFRYTHRRYLFRRFPYSIIDQVAPEELRVIGDVQTTGKIARAKFIFICLLTFYNLAYNIQTYGNKQEKIQ